MKHSWIFSGVLSLGLAACAGGTSAGSDSTPAAPSSTSTADTSVPATTSSALQNTDKLPAAAKSLLSTPAAQASVAAAAGAGVCGVNLAAIQADITQIISDAAAGNISALMNDISALTACVGAACAAGTIPDPNSFLPPSAACPGCGAAGSVPAAPDPNSFLPPSAACPGCGTSSIPSIP